MTQNQFVIARWADALRPVRHFLLPPLANFLADERRSVEKLGTIASVYGNYAVDVPDAFTCLEKHLTEQKTPAKRKANVGVALAVMGRWEQVWPLLKASPDPTVRSYLIERLGRGGADPKRLIIRLDEERDVAIRRAIVLSLGDFALERLSYGERQNLLPRLLQIYRDDPDPGMHGATEWLLRQWQAQEKVEEIDKELATGKVEGERQWYVNGHGHAMMIPARPSEQQTHRRFAIAAKDVTVEQFLKFRPAYKPNKFNASTPDCPVNMVTWHDAAAYCNWLSEKEGIRKEEWCYETNPRGEVTSMKEDYLNLAGYRLPTEAEWDLACRAGSSREFFYGDSIELLPRYSWHYGNASFITHPVGLLRPNDLGLFDMHGNVWQWMQDVCGEAAEADQDIGHINSNDLRMFRGGAAGSLAHDVRTDNRYFYWKPAQRGSEQGFRVVRTLLDSRPDAKPGQPRKNTGQRLVFDADFSKGPCGFWMDIDQHRVVQRINDAAKIETEYANGQFHLRLKAEGVWQSPMPTNREFTDFACEIEAQSGQNGLGGWGLALVPIKPPSPSHLDRN